MISKEHKKHTDIARPSYGHFGRNEWSIIGTECAVIRAFTDVVIRALSPVYKCAYADAKHPDGGGDMRTRERLEAEPFIEYSNNINYYQLNYRKPESKFDLRRALADADIIFVNGNHGDAVAQVLIIDSAKRSSLEKRLSKLTNVELILLKESGDELPEALREAIPSLGQVPIYQLNDTDNIVRFFKAKMKKAQPLLNGLVLAGGKSVRMGHDKSQIKWHGKEQRYFMADLLKDHCHEVFISCRPAQQKEIDPHYATLTDTFMDLGPFGAILSAFREKPDVAWLIVACDLPLVDTEILQFLCANRNVSTMATTFESPSDHFPEPLITIWEPKSYPLLLSFLSQGYTCPRKVLLNSDINLLKAPHDDALTNVNTPEDSQRVELILRQKLFQDHAG